MIFYSNDSYAFILLRLPLAQSNEEMTKYAEKHYWDAYLNVGNFVYMSIAQFPLAH